MLYGSGADLGIALVTDPRIKAVGFTGSRSGGTALVAAAAARPEPIPVYAEMSSINPVFLLDGALASRGADLARAFVGSLTMGSGQFCTNPGLVIAVDGPGLDTFLAAARDALAQAPATPMLTPGIAESYANGVSKLSGEADLVVRGESSDSETACRAALFATDAESFLSSATLQAEVFGSSSLIVRCADIAEVQTVAEHIEGQLTVTVHADEADYEDARAASAAARTQSGPDSLRRLAHRRRGLPRHDARRSLPRDVGPPQHVGRRTRNRTLSAARLLPERAELVAAQRNR